MQDPVQKILKEFIPLKHIEGKSKVLPLGQALRKFVQPGLTLHLGTASNLAAWLATCILREEKWEVDVMPEIGQQSILDLTSGLF
ncbi:MAG: hypothetical protein HY882_01800 [Deltaproteobacteria bacterium]|nr:hypothetical protein [Deltaproteobacteria bacterium]